MLADYKIEAHELRLLLLLSITHRYDKSTISSSTNPAEQWFEKMVSGKYLGELARLACLDLHSAGLLWKDLPLSALMNERHGLDTEVMSRSVAIEKAEVAGYVEKETGMKTEDGDAEVLLALFDAIGKRSARLSGALIAGLVEHMGAKGCTIAVDGSVFEHYRWVSEALRADGRD